MHKEILMKLKYDIHSYVRRSLICIFSNPLSNTVYWQNRPFRSRFQALLFSLQKSTSFRLEGHTCTIADNISWNGPLRIFGLPVSFERGFTLNMRWNAKLESQYFTSLTLWEVIELAKSAGGARVQVERFRSYCPGVCRYFVDYHLTIKLQLT